MPVRAWPTITIGGDDVGVGDLGMLLAPVDEAEPGREVLDDLARRRSARRARAGALRCAASRRSRSSPACHVGSPKSSRPVGVERHGRRDGRRRARMSGIGASCEPMPRQASVPTDARRVDPRGVLVLLRGRTRGGVRRWWRPERSRPRRRRPRSPCRPRRPAPRRASVPAPATPQTVLPDYASLVATAASQLAVYDIARRRRSPMRELENPWPSGGRRSDACAVPQVFLGRRRSAPTAG